MTPTSFSKSTAAELAEISRQGQKELKERQAQEAIQQEERAILSLGKGTAAFQSGSTAAFRINTPAHSTSSSRAAFTSSIVVHGVQESMLRWNLLLLRS